MTKTPPETIAARVQALRQHLQQRHLTGMVVVNEANRRYLSGFTGSTGWLVITADAARLITDGRYWERVAEEAPYYELVRVRQRYDETLKETFGLLSGSVGFEAQTVTVDQFERLFAPVEQVEWTRADDLVATLRQVKGDEELEIIRRAAAITDAAMARVPELLHPGMTEADLAWELEKAMREGGAQGLAFPSIVAFGENSALPHAEPGDRPLRTEMAITIDMGARVDGYCADLTRSFWYGTRPDAAYLRAWKAVREALIAGIIGLRPGVSGRMVDALARDTLGRYGYKEAFLHSLGHGVGLVVHEGPRLSRLSDDVLAARNVVTVEPGVYFAKRWGIRLEELVIVWDNGAQVVSQAPMWVTIPPQ